MIGGARFFALFTASKSTDFGTNSVAGNLKVKLNRVNLPQLWLLTRLTSASYQDLTLFGALMLV